MAESTATSLSGKIIVVTGASSGIGRGAAQQFAAKGATVVLAARRGYLLDQMVQDFEGAGYRALAVPTDVSRPEEVEKLAEKAIESFGHIDVWVNNAGVGVIGRFSDVPLRDHEQLIQTNLLGTLYGSYHALRHFRTRETGTLINIASMFGKVPSPYWSSYCAANYGIVGLCDALRQEVQQSHMENIHVCSVLPMTTDTPFFEHMANYTGHQVAMAPPVYDAQQVVDVIVGLALRPQDEIIVGRTGKVMNAVHSLVPGATENLIGMQTHRMQFKAPVAEETDGAVQHPMRTGTQVAGGHLQQSA